VLLTEEGKDLCVNIVELEGRHCVGVEEAKIHSQDSSHINFFICT
jgi:hypothetical protein